MVHSFYWSEVVKGVLSQGIFFMSGRAGVVFVYCALDVCIVLFLCFWLSVPVQSFAWKDL